MMLALALLACAVWLMGFGFLIGYSFGHYSGMCSYEDARRACIPDPEPSESNPDE